MAEITAYVNNDVCLSTGKGNYRIAFDDLLAIESPKTTGMFNPDFSFSLKFLGNRYLEIYDTTMEDLTQGYELLLAHWESFNRHNRVFENSNGPGKTSKLSDGRILVNWGGNQVIIYLSDLEGVKNIGKGLRIFYHTRQPTTFLSEKPENINLLQSGLETHIREVKVV